MSLFKARDWWHVNCGHDEEFDKGCMCVANIDSDGSGDVKVCVGSFQGMLRVYHPKDRDFRVEDLLLEQSLDAPILQLEAGNFNSNGGISLAVLHPRSLVVYTLSPVGNNQQQASYYSLTKNYEHKFERTAANFVYGPFGGSAAMDYICVQSMDGQLTVYEQETFTFSRFLHNFLLPGPLCYAQKIDSFVTCNSSFEVECYKYQVLASSSADKTAEGEESGLTQQKRVQVDWSFVLGERVVDIRVARFSRSLTAGQIDILVLGERTLYALSEIGQPRLQIRLEYAPTAITTFQHVDDDGQGAIHSAVISSNTGALMVYRDMQLLWAAKGELIPVGLSVNQFGNLKGLVTSFDDAGQLAITYMGTDPPLNVVGGFECKELNYEEMDEEHRRLLSIIREATSDSKMEPSDRVLLRAQVPNRLDSTTSGGDDESGRPKRSLTVRLFISYSGSGSLENVNLSIQCPAPLSCSQDTINLASLKGGNTTPVIVSLTFYCGTQCLPSTNTIPVIAAYTTSMGEPRTSRCDVTLPLCLFCTIVAPLKNAGYKITLDTNKMPPQMTQLFEDMVMQSTVGSELTQRPASTNVLSFQYFSGHDVTILVSKSAGRYRLQSGSFEALWLIADALCQRLNSYFQADGAKGGEEAFAISFQEALPLQDFFNSIDEHFDARAVWSKTSEQLGERAHQFRSIQKRLLVRFKDRNPAPLGHLDTLLEGTFTQLNELGAKMEGCMEKLKAAAHKLSCGCELILLLIRYRFSLDNENYEALRSYLSPTVLDATEQGWEECTDAAMTHLLRTSLAKSAKDSAGGVPAPLAPLADTSKLKKHIGIVCERLARGARLTGDAK